MAPGLGSADKTHRNRRHYCRLVLPNATQRACSPPCTETVSLPSKARTNADACKDCRRVQGPESQNGRMQPRVACRQMPTECWEGAEIDAGSRDRDQRGINMNMKTKTTNHWRSKGILVCHQSVWRRCVPRGAWRITDDPQVRLAAVTSYQPCSHTVSNRGLKLARTR